MFRRVAQMYLVALLCGVLLLILIVGVLVAQSPTQVAIPRSAEPEPNPPADPAPLEICGPFPLWQSDGKTIFLPLNLPDEIVVKTETNSQGTIDRTLEDLRHVP